MADAPEQSSSLAAGILMVVLLSGVGVGADALLKLASSQPNRFGNPYFFSGAAVYAATAFAWVVAMKHLKLAILGAFYSVATALLLSIVGIVFFHESLTLRESLGIGLGVLSLLLLSR